VKTLEESGVASVLEILDIVEIPIYINYPRPSRNCIGAHRIVKRIDTNYVRT
jgi:hypothetical protein